MLVLCISMTITFIFTMAVLIIAIFIAIAWTYIINVIISMANTSASIISTAAMDCYKKYDKYWYSYHCDYSYDSYD